MTCVIDLFHTMAQHMHARNDGQMILLVFDLHV